MTPKLKASELIEKFHPHAQYWDCYNDCPLEYNHANKICRLVVDEVLKELDHIILSVNDETRYDIKNYVIKYWNEVKEELNKQ